MRRKSKSFVHLIFFAGALLLILYLNLYPASEKPYPWTTIRYKTISATLPEPRGICPGLADSSKPALVVARVTADGSPTWLDSLADLYHLCVYTADAPLNPGSKHLQVPANRGHEAMAYLTFLIDNYDQIPSTGAVFVHGSRWSWHNDAQDYDNAALLAALNVSNALIPFGYHNLRCDWSAGTCSPLSNEPQGSLATSAHAVLEPWNLRAVSDAGLPRALAALFSGDEKSRLRRNDAVRAQCCAQFVVARDRVWQHSRDEYIALRQWLLDGNWGTGTQVSFRSARVAPEDDRVAGRILSYVWHILFSQEGQSNVHSSSPGIDLKLLNSQACPPASQCYCRLYGRCGLEGCATSHCPGQYRVPPGYRLPDNWAATHS